jgi:deoxyadenosine/deoxycytidine kinase
MNKFIAVAGNIGVGKSTLVEMLACRLGWQPLYEPVDTNPYLADFYADMPAWSFQSQVYFLALRLRVHRQIIGHATSVILDRSVYEDAEIFAYNLYLQGGLSERDHTTYRELYQSLIEFLPPPDLLIYLRASTDTLLRRIACRGRDYERSISGEYLSGLNSLYERWIDGFNLCPVLTVPADALDYVAHPRHLDLIATKINDKLMGQEEVVFAPDEVNGGQD